jgi:hypothetical protein
LSGLRQIADVYRSPALCKVDYPSTSKGGDPVTLTITTLATLAVTANRIDPALAQYRP